MKKIIALLSLVSLLLLTSCGDKEDQNVDTNVGNVQNEQQQDEVNVLDENLDEGFEIIEIDDVSSEVLQ